MKKAPKAVGAALALPLLLLAGCAPSTTPQPTAPPRPTATPTPAVTSTPAPTATPTPTLPPPEPLGLVRLWRTATQDTVWAIGTADVLGDGHPEVWAASYDHTFYLLQAGGEITRSFTTAAPLYTALPADLDGDGRSEFLLGGDDNLVHALEHDAVERWSYEAGGRVTHLAVGDVDGDGAAEVLAASWDGTLHILDASGQEEGRLSLDGRPSALALADLDADRRAEVLVGTEAGHVAVLESGGKVIWERSFEGAIRGLVSRDFDGDGYHEILVASRGGLVALIGTDYAPRWAQRISGTIVTLGETLLDGQVIVGRSEGITSLNLRDGQVLWEYGTRQGVWSLAVLDEGAEPVLVAGTDGGAILLLNRLGQHRGNIQLPSRVHGLVTADLDGDGHLEIVARSGDYVHALRPTAGGEAGEGPPTVTTQPRWLEPSPLPPVPEGYLSLVAVGDVMLSRSIEERMQAYGPRYPFQPFQPLLSQADIAVGNLECVLAQGGEPAEKTYVFRAHPDTAVGLKEAGFDVLSLANNHTLDYGPAGLEETIAALEAQKIRPVGAGLQASAPVLFEVRGIRVAILARNTIGTPQMGIAWADDETTLRQDVAQAAAQADVVVLLLHAGQEYATETTEKQRTLARAAVEAGADLVIGHHTHGIQETAEYQDGFIAYGLGNFVFDIDIVDTARDGALLYALLSKDGLTRVDWIPSRIVDDVQPRPLAAAGGGVEVRPLLLKTSEPLPPPPSPRPTYVLSATVEPAGTVQVLEQVGFPNTTGNSLEEAIFFVFPNAFSETFFLQDIQATQGGQSAAASYSLVGTSLRVFLPRVLEAGQGVTISLAYSLSLATLDRETWPPQGNLGRSADGQIVHLGHWYPQLVPYERGYGWQTWEYHPVGDPFVSEVADYRVTVAASAGYTAWGSGERRSEGSPWRFSLDAGRDFALFLAQGYLESRGEADGITVVSVFRPEHSPAGQAAREVAERSLAFFQKKYGPYPYRNLTVAEAEMDAGMEYSGMVLVGTRWYADYPGRPDSVLPALTAHEVAHQWWYGVVGNDQVRQPWLDEALVRYSELLFYENTYPEAVDWWWLTRVDERNPSGPLDRTIYDFDDPHLYVNNLYGQGARFLRDLRARLGDDLFFTFLQRYYRANAWRIATTRDFFQMVEKVSGEPADDLRRLYFER